MRSDSHRRRTDRTVGVESLSTAQLLALHERYFGFLHPKSKERILEAALRHGWDRSWDDAPLAA